MNTKTGSWIGGTVIVAVLAGVAAWFLVLAPRLENIEAIKGETVAVKDQNDILELKIEKLKVEFAKLDDYKAEIAALQVQIPTAAALADYAREVATAAEANSVVVTSWAPGAPLSFMPVGPVAAPAPDAGAVDDPDADPAAGSAGVAPGAVQIPGFVAMPFNMTVVGTYNNAQGFLTQLQTGTQRLFLVTNLVGNGQQQAEASAGRPATAPGDIELTVTGFTYVLEDQLNGPAAPAEPAPLPGSGGGSNPLAPIAGQ